MYSRHTRGKTERRSTPLVDARPGTVYLILLTIYYHVVGTVFLRIAVFSLKYDVPRALKYAAHLALLMHPWLLVSYPRQILQNLFVILPMSSPNTSAAHKKGTTARVLEVVRQVVDDSCIEERVLP